MRLSGLAKFRVSNSGAGSGNATASDILSGKTASTDAGDIVGTMPNKVGSATVITPSTADQAIPQGYYGGVVGDGKVKAITITAGNNIVARYNASQSGNETVMTKKAEYQINYAGSIRVSFTLRPNVTAATSVEARVYKNGVAIGTLRSVTASTTFDEDFAGIVTGDLIQIYCRTTDSGNYYYLDTSYIKITEAPVIRLLG